MADTETKTPLEANGDTIAEIKTMVDALPEKGGDTGINVTGKVGDGIVIKSVDTDGKPTEWESVALAKADSSNIKNEDAEQWRTRLAALPGAKIYCKADSSGKLLAYTDKACTQAANYTAAMTLADYGNSLLIYGNKTYQCTGFESPASAPGALVVAVYFRAELTSSGAVKTEVAKFNPMDYLAGTISSPVTITELIPASEARVASVEEDAKVVRTILLGEEEETK